jgi:RNA polymerase sigma-70 factor (sigma-E family)
VVHSTDTEAYREFVSARMEQWRRTAYLLCGSWHTADDLVSTALMKLYRHWRRVVAMQNPEGYVHRILLRAWLDERRRPWRREHVNARPPDRAGGVDPSSVADKLAMLGLLAELPPRRRAVLVLRYFCDLSVEDTADVLDCSTGTVKSQTARALESLRARLVGISVANDVNHIVEEDLWT